MARVFLHGEIVGEPDPPVDVTEWAQAELKLAKDKLRRAERDQCWADTAALSGRIGALRETLFHLQKGAS